jgi:hypothetical protein
MIGIHGEGYAAINKDFVALRRADSRGVAGGGVVPESGGGE